MDSETEQFLRAENAELRARLEEAEETLRAIRAGEVEALVVEGAAGPQLFTLESAATASNQFRGEVLAQVSDVVIAVDNDQRVSFLNAAAERQYGVIAGDVLGCKLYEVYSPRWRHPCEEAKIIGALRERGEWRGEKIHVTRDGREIQVESTITELRNRDGTPSGRLVVVRDITERKRAEAALRNSEEMHRIFFELGTVGMVYASPEGHFLHANEKYSEITGYTNAELAGLDLFDLTHPDDREKGREDFDLYLQGKRPVYAAEKRYVRKDGSIAWVSVTARMVHGADGRRTHSIGIVEDITARRHAEESIARMNAELEERVAQRTAELSRANRALQVLKKCDAALVRETDEIQLLNRICKTIVEIGGAEMAWVGFAEDDKNKTVRPVALAGDIHQYLKTARITWADKPHGRGPTGTAIRTHEVNACHNTASDIRVIPWRKELLQRSYASSIALPLVLENRCLGALTIYSRDLEAFRGEELDLLKQLAGDLTYGIVALRTRAERAQLQRELLTISEREKQLISQELHDGLCQNLTGTAMLGGVLHQRLAARKDPDAEYAKHIYEILGTAVNEARNLSHGLQPVGPEANGLMNALAQLAETVCNLFCIGCTFDCPEPVLLENAVASTHLFRITQEAINNARRHGEAGNIVIGLHKTSKGIVLTIRDDGIGIPENLPKKRGMGLRSMILRATEIGAALTTQRTGDTGTVVTCTVPFPAFTPANPACSA